MDKKSFELPTAHYDDQLYTVDEKICALLKERKELSNHNQSFPPDEVIAEWAQKYGFYEEYLNSLFGTMMVEEEFRPRVEPKNFIKHISILKSVLLGDKLYTITAIKQYKNASVVMLHVDWDEPESENRQLDHHYYSLELLVGEEYDCRNDGGSGSTGHFIHNFIVSPPLPDQLTGMDFIFREHEGHFTNKPTGVEIVFHV